MIFLLALSGCMSVPTSPAPRFYSLQAVEKSQAGPKINIPDNIIIGFGPVKVPEYENRPQIVTKGKDNELKFSEFNRWGEPLNAALEYVISEDIAVLLPNAVVKTHPWNSAIPVKYQVIVDIVRLDSELDKDLVVTAEWSVIDAQNKKMLLMRRSEFRQPVSPHGYSGLVEALNKVCVSLGGEISEAVASLAAQNEAKENVPASK